MPFHIETGAADPGPATAVAEETVSVPAGTWDIDAIHSTIGFEVKHLGISTFRGRFNGYSGTLEASENGLEKVSGESYEDFVETEIFKKLGMTLTSKRVDGARVYSVTPGPIASKPASAVA